MAKSAATEDTSKMFRGTFNDCRRHQAWLKGKTAVLMNHPNDARTVRAQFDDQTLSESFGWWDFERADFDDIKELGGLKE